MIALTFNTVAAVLEREFHIERARIRPDSTFGELGLDASSRRDFVLAVEDAFRLHLPAGRVDSVDAGTDLLRLCEAVAGSASDFVPQRPTPRSQVESVARSGSGT